MPVCASREATSFMTRSSTERENPQYAPCGLISGCQLADLDIGEISTWPKIGIYLCIYTVDRLMGTDRLEVFTSRIPNISIDFDQRKIIIAIK